MTVRDTSLEALRKILPTLPKRQGAVLALFLRDPSVEWCNEALAWALGRKEHAISPRVLELRKAGYLIDVGRRTKANGNSAHHWRLKMDMLF
jgi:hypothetical protein